MWADGLKWANLGDGQGRSGCRRQEIRIEMLIYHFTASITF
jgi:hypothetical protein